MLDAIGVQPPYPSAIRVSRGYLRASIEFQKAQPPEGLSIGGWTMVTEDGERRGPRAFAYSLQPLEEGGRIVGWAADVSLRVRKHLYLDVDAEWSDQEGSACQGAQQSGRWHFHLKNRRA